MDTAFWLGILQTVGAAVVVAALFAAGRTYLRHQLLEQRVDALEPRVEASEKVGAAVGEMNGLLRVLEGAIEELKSTMKESTQAITTQGLQLAEVHGQLKAKPRSSGRRAND